MKRKTMKLKASMAIFTAMLSGLAVLTACSREANQPVQIEQSPVAESARPVPIPVPILPAVDPAKCKPGHGNYVYWAAGDQVFRFKFDPDEPLHPTPDKNEWGNPQVSGREDVPSAPVPSEPMGCYGNPLRAGEVPYVYSFDKRLSNNIFGRKLDLCCGRGSTFSTRSRTFGKSGVGGSLSRLYSTATKCRERKPGIRECGLGAMTGWDDYRASHIFKIDKALLSSNSEVADVLFSLSGLGVTVDGKKTDRDMQSQINLYGDVQLDISVQVLENEFDLIAPYLSGLINYVVQAHVPNYQWTVAKKSNTSISESKK